VRSGLPFAALLFAALIVMPALASAGPAQDSVSATRDESMWRLSWPAFSWTEGAATVAAGTLSGVLWLREPPRAARWHGGVLFDDAVRNQLRLSSGRARARARSLGDLPYYAAPVIPLIVDPLLVAWLGRDDGKAALNLELVSLEAFAYAGLSSFISTRLSLRQRPDSEQCWREHPDGVGCEPVDTEAFWSGHTTIAAASAGLVCANHRYLALWGHSVADASACVLATAGAVGTAVSRILADRHYATDVIVGLGMGFGFGYAVPVLLHYSHGRRDVRVALQPVTIGVGSELSLAGSF
jgi:membrane-associated phospholipid phosphatase